MKVPVLFGHSIVGARMVVGMLLAVLLQTGVKAETELSAAAGESDSEPHFEVVLTPVVGADGSVAAIGVDSVVYGGLADDAKAFTLSAPVVYAGAYGIAERVRNLTVTDSSGPVALSVTDDPEASGGFPYFRRWAAERDVTFPVRIVYQTLVEPPTDRRGPPFNIKASAGGVSGAGSGFLVIPNNVASRYSRVHWNLGGFDSPSAIGVTTFGEGSFELAGPPERLIQGWYMAGPLGRYPIPSDGVGFSATWLGDFPFDPESEMNLAADIYRYLATFFGYLSPPPRYRVFLRIVDSTHTRFSGTALGSSFMLSGGPNSGRESDSAAPRDTIIHEMIHMWVGQIEGPQGVTSWFSEGLTSYYTLVLPLRAGYVSRSEYVERINDVAERYYTSPAINMSAEAIAEVGFGDLAAQRTPYSRGTLYFADLDSRIRRASNGSRGLDQFMGDIFKRRHEEEHYIFDHDAWRAALSEELGEDAVTQFEEQVLGGMTLVPASDAFGDCFVREPWTYASDDVEHPGYRWTQKASCSCVGD